MSNFVRSSKFRHVFAEPPRTDSQFSNFRLSTVTGDQNYIKANGKYFAIGVQGGGGPFAVINLDKPGKVAADHPLVQGHSAAVLDFEFNPFDDQIMASASEDQTVKVWGIPEGGMTSNLVEPLVDLHGHAKKVTLLRFHPTASNVLASVSADHSVKVWDIQNGTEMSSLNDCHSELIQDIVWNYNGSSFATSCKDKSIRVCDARGATVSQTIENAHDGAKSMKLSFLGNSGLLLSTGFTKQSGRQFKIWDPRNTSKEVKKVDIDQAAGVIMPFYDPDTCLLYLAGKGDGNIRYFELTNGATDCFLISDYRSSVSAKGMAMVPKNSLNVMGCESTRLLKLTSNTVEPLSFVVPRKSEAFQDDLYPESASKEAAHCAEEWFNGSDLDPILKSLDPTKKGSSSSASSAPKPVFKSNAVLTAELTAANARIAALEAQLSAAGIEPGV